MTNLTISQFLAGMVAISKNTNWALSQGNTGEVLLSLCLVDSTPTSAQQSALKKCSAMTAVVNSSLAMTAVVNSSLAMTAVVNSSLAMTAVVNSSLAMTVVINSSLAMTAVVNSSSAMTAVANSSSAMTALLNDSRTLVTDAAFRVDSWVDVNCLVLGCVLDGGTDKKDIYPPSSELSSVLCKQRTKSGQEREILWGLGQELKVCPEPTVALYRYSRSNSIVYHLLD